MKRLLAAALLFAAGFAAPGNGFARFVTQSDFTQNIMLKTVPLGFGGAFTALADTNAAILINPAGIAQHKGSMRVAGEYAHSGGSSSDAFSVSVIDFKASEIIAMALAYDRDTLRLNNSVTLNHFTLAAATEMGSTLFVGASLKGFVSAVEGPSRGPDGADMDVGFLLRPIPLLSFGVSGRNLLQGHRLEEFPLQLAAGAALILEPHARIAVDMLYDFKTSSPEKINAGFGAEVRAAEGIHLRGGYGLDRIRDDNFFSFGVTAAGPRMGLNFTYSRRLSPSSNTFAAGIELEI